MSFVYIVLVPFMDFNVRFFVILYSAVRLIFMFVACICNIVQSRDLVFVFSRGTAQYKKSSNYIMLC